MGETPVRSSGDNYAPSFGLDEEQQAILDQADRFARKELYPLCERMDRDEWWPEAAFPKIGDNGFFGVTIPEEYGGSGQDLLAAGLVLQGFARWNHAMALSWVAHDNLCANNIYRNGNEQQRRKCLPDLCAGRKIGALGLTEPGAGSDALGSMRTTARRDGDYYVLNGGKIYITNGPSPTSSWSTPRPIVQKARRAFPPSSSKRAFPDSRSHRN